MKMQGKTVLITGSTDGVGRYVASQLAAEGAHVLIHGRDAARADALIGEIKRAGHEAPKFYSADLSSLAGVRQLAEAVLAGHDDLIAGFKPTSAHDLIALDRVYLNRLEMDGLIRGDEPNIRSVWPPLHRCRGNDHRVLLDPCHDLRLYEGAGPEPMFLVVEAGLELDRATCLVDLIIDDFKLALR